MKDLTKGNIYKTLFLFGFPLVISGLLSTSFNIVDKAIVGKFLGERAFAATGSVSPLITASSSLFWGYIVGVSIYIAKLFGSKDYERLKSVFYVNLTFIFLCSVVICGGLILFKNQVFDFLNVDESLREEASKYFIVYVGGLFFITSTVMGNYTISSFGIAGFSLVTSILSAIINLVGNILSAAVFDWGLTGIAAFSVLAALVNDALYLWKIRRCFKEMGVDKTKVDFSFSHIKNALPIAIPNMVQQVVMYAAGMLVSPIVNKMGVEATASYSVSSSVYEIASNAYMNSSRAPTTYVAQCAGEKRYDKINKGMFVGLLQSLAYGLPFILFCSLFPKLICGLFLKEDASALTIEYSYLFARRYLPFLFFHIPCNLMHGLFKAIKAPVHLISGTFVASASRISLSYLLISQGIKGFFLAWVLSWVIEAVYVGALFFLGLWRPDRKEKIKQNIA